MLYNLFTFFTHTLAHSHAVSLKGKWLCGACGSTAVITHIWRAANRGPGGAPSSSVNSHPVLSRPPNLSGTMAPGEHRLKQVHGSPSWNAAGPVTPGATTIGRHHAPTGQQGEPGASGPAQARPHVRPRRPALLLTTCFRRKVPGSGSGVSCEWVVVLWPLVPAGRNCADHVSLLQCLHHHDKPSKTWDERKGRPCRGSVT